MTTSDFYFTYPQQVGNLPVPREYRDHSFMDMDIDAFPVGQDSVTGWNVYWGEGHEIACLLSDRPKLDIPF
jgi:hypothetical protein